MSRVSVMYVLHNIIGGVDPCHIEFFMKDFCSRLREASGSRRSGASVQHDVLPLRSQNTARAQSKGDSTWHCQYQFAEQAAVVSWRTHRIIFERDDNVICI